MAAEHPQAEAAVLEEQEQLLEVVVVNEDSAVVVKLSALEHPFSLES